jgi:hypothetical protein
MVKEAKPRQGFFEKERYGPVNAVCKTFTAFSQGEFPVACANVLPARRRAALSPVADFRTKGLDHFECLARSFFIGSSAASRWFKWRDQKSRRIRGGD